MDKLRMLTKVVEHAPRAVLCTHVKCTFPKPIMASVLPTRDTPVYCDRFHSPLLTDASACATFLLRAHIRAMPCSAAATVLAVGAFTTKQPYCIYTADVKQMNLPAAVPRRTFGTNCMFKSVHMCTLQFNACSNLRIMSDSSKLRCRNT